MADAFARKVDQQIAFAGSVLDALRTQPAAFTQNALLQAAYLQLELAALYYFAEILQRHSVAPSPNELEVACLDDVKVLLEPCRETADVSEFLSLQSDPSSWWSRFQRQRQSLRVVEKQGALKGKLFQTDEEEESLPYERIGTVDFESVSNNANVEDAWHILTSLRSLVERQRQVSDEF